jgi:hypothetical protein
VPEADRRQQDDLREQGGEVRGQLGDQHAAEGLPDRDRRLAQVEAADGLLVDEDQVVEVVDLLDGVRIAGARAGDLWA